MYLKHYEIFFRYDFCGCKKKTIPRCVAGKTKNILDPSY